MVCLEIRNKGTSRAWTVSSSRTLRKIAPVSSSRFKEQGYSSTFSASALITWGRGDEGTVFSEFEVKKEIPADSLLALKFTAALFGSPAIGSSRGEIFENLSCAEVGATEVKVPVESRGRNPGRSCFAFESLHSDCEIAQRWKESLCLVLQAVHSDSPS